MSAPNGPCVVDLDWSYFVFAGALVLVTIMRSSRFFQSKRYHLFLYADYSDVYQQQRLCTQRCNVLFCFLGQRFFSVGLASLRACVNGFFPHVVSDAPRSPPPA